MGKRKGNILIIILPIIAILGITAIGLFYWQNKNQSKTITSQTGGIYGKATFGPTCPGAQRIGQNCSAPFVGTIVIGRQTGLDNGGSFEEVTRFQTKEDGSFRVSLPPGDFVAKQLSSGSYWFSKIQIHVGRSGYNNLDLTFDTGIR